MLKRQRTRRRMIRIAQRGSLGLLVLAFLCTSDDADAQDPVDVAPPLPNVLLLTDTSGSMEYEVDGTLPDAASVCSSTGSYKSRWINLIEALTGTINGYGCFSHDREDSVFISEFELPGPVAPYDQGYFLPYHRATSNGCMYTPGNLATNPLAWDPNPFDFRDTSGLGAACGTAWDQQRDGLLDTYRDRVRFGLFTFDAKPD